MKGWSKEKTSQIRLAYSRVPCELARKETLTWVPGFVRRSLWVFLINVMNHASVLSRTQPEVSPGRERGREGESDEGWREGQTIKKDRKSNIKMEKERNGLYCKNAGRIPMVYGHILCRPMYIHSHSE